MCNVSIVDRRSWQYQVMERMSRLPLVDTRSWVKGNKRFAGVRPFLCSAFDFEVDF